METVTGLVSTIIPVHNRPVLLREAVESVLAQSYRPIEVIIVDDGSTDGTRAVGEAFQESLPDTVHFIRKINQGPGLAREEGRQRARGEFIQYLDSDDILLPEKFERQVAGLDKHPECGASYGMTRFVVRGRHSSDQPLKRTGEQIKRMFPSFLESRWWSTSTPLYRRALLDAAGPWSDLMNEEDWEYECRVAAQDVRLHYCQNFVSETRDHEGDRLCRNGSRDCRKLIHRARAHALIFKHAVGAGITANAPEMQHFSRELFLLSRQCGAAGLVVEAKDLFALSRRASSPARANGLDYQLYRLIAGAFGWAHAGRLACWTDRFRS